MKKNIHFWLFSLCLILGNLQNTYAQSFTIGVGTGSNGPTTYPTPLGNWFEVSRQQFLYRNTELTSAGMTVGMTITSLSFTVTNVNAATPIKNYKIWVGNTTVNTLTSWIPTNSMSNGGNPVHGPVTVPNTVGVKTFTISPNFVWNGDNIVVQVFHNNNTNNTIPEFSENFSCIYTQGLPFMATRLITNDYMTEAQILDDTPNGSSSLTNRPQIIFNTSPSSLVTPPNFIGTALSSNSAQLTWTDIAGEINYVLEYAPNNPINFVTLATLPSNTISYTHSGLPTGSRHYYRLKAINVITTSPYTSIVEVNTLGGMKIFADSTAHLQGVVVSIPIRVKNFTNIVSAQGTVEFNNTVLAYQSTSGYNFPNTTASDFNLSGGNKLSFVFSSGTNVTLADSSVLFNINFNIIGAFGSKSDILFTNSPVPIEVADNTFTPVGVTTKKGIVQVLNTSLVSGRIINHATPARGVQRTIVSTLPATQVITTDTTGYYALQLNGGVSYTIAPIKNNDSLMTNGITSLDLALIRRHILGTQLLPTAYKMIAADVNQSNSITALDISAMTQVILGTANTFNNRRWTMVRSNQVLTTATAFTYDSLRTLTPTQGTHPNQDFIAVKLGDVNDTWVYTTKDTKIINLEVARAEALPQERVVIPFKVRDFTQVGSMQFTLQWNPQVISFVEVKNKALAPNFALNRTAEGILTLAWFDAEGKYTSLPNGSDAFELVFEAKGNAGTESNIDITSKVTPIFAYDVEDKEMLVQRKAGKVSIVTEKTGELLLYPNPTTGHKLYIDAPHKQAYTLAFTNVLGQNVLKLQGDGSDVLDLKRLTKGVYVVQIETNGKITTQKIVIQ